MAGQVKVTIADKDWIADLANTPWEQVQGLGGITGIAPGTGMLFDMGFEQVITVTTEPMLFPLDIAFFSEAMVITEIYRNIQPGYLVTSTSPARYFFEVNAGELDGINSDSQATFELLTPVIAVAASDWVSPMVSFLGFILMCVLMVELVGDFTKSTSAEEAKASSFPSNRRKS